MASTVTANWVRLGRIKPLKYRSVEGAGEDRGAIIGLLPKAVEVQVGDDGGKSVQLTEDHADPNNFAESFFCLGLSDLVRLRGELDNIIESRPAEAAEPAP